MIFNLYKFENKILLNMRINNERQLTEDQILTILTNNGYFAKHSTGGIFSGRKQIKTALHGLEFVVKKNSNFIDIDVVIPIWVRLLGIVGMMLIGTLVLSLVFEDAVFVRGGILVYLLGAVIGDSIYKSSKKEQIKLGYDNISRLLL